MKTSEKQAAPTLRLVGGETAAGTVLVLGPEELATLHRLAELRGETPEQTAAECLRMTLRELRGV